jgi:hypothetical protein
MHTRCPERVKKRLTCPSVVCLLSPAADMIRERRWISGDRMPGAWGYRGGYAWGYAWRFRIPQLYPPSRVQIPTQIQGASRSLGEQNQPRLALGGAPLGPPIVPPQGRIHFPTSVFPLRSLLTITAFSQMDVVASLGALLAWVRFLSRITAIKGRLKQKFAASLEQEREG